MRRHSWVAVAVLGAAAWGAQAADRVDELAVRSKALAGNAALAEPAAHSNAPFRASYDPIPGLLHRDDPLARKPQGACESHTRDLCYDLVDRRIVYRPVRQFMPQVDGFTAESVSLRHDRLILKYSFR